MAFNLQKNDLTTIFVRYFLHVRSSVHAHDQDQFDSISDNDEHHHAHLKIQRLQRLVLFQRKAEVGGGKVIDLGECV